MTTPPKVVAALEWGTTVRVVREDGSIWDWRLDKAWYPVAPPIPDAPMVLARDADAPGPKDWVCQQCRGQLGAHFMAYNQSWANRCYACGSGRPA